MGIPSALLVDTVDIYTAKTASNDGVYSGGTTVAVANKSCLLQPLSEEQLATIGGSFDKTRICLLCDADSNITSGRKIVLQKSVSYGTGTVTYVEQEPRTLRDPMSIGSSHHMEAILIVEQ